MAIESNDSSTIQQNVNDILYTKNYLLVDEEEYVPFLTNRSLSYHVDCVLYANQMNIHPDLDPDMQYSYLLNTIRSMERKYQPWQKTLADKDIECVKKYFGYSNERAKEALRILNDDQLAEIRKRTDKGGT